jgi:intracellular multiplication protein IcmB
LTSEEVSEEKRQRKAAAKGPKVAEGQWLERASENLYSRHLAFTRRMVADLNSFGIKTRELNAKAAIVACRDSIYPDRVGSPWSPVLPGDLIRPRLPTEEEIKEGDTSCLFWPPLDSQVLDLDAEVVSNSPAIVKIGDLAFGAIDMTIGPEQPQSFSRLMGRLIDSGESMPWRISFLLEGGGMHATAFSRMLASILVWAGSDNKRIHAAMRALKDYDLRGGTVIRLRVSLGAWAPASNIPLLRRRMATLQQAVEGWGNCATSSIVGDPVEGWASSVMMMDCASTAPSSAAPLEEALALLPWQRPASPWDGGTVVFKTPDGKMWPYEPGSSLQTAFIDLVFAPPGRGKSVLMNSINLACCLAPQRTRNAALPRLAIIDVGPSSKGLVSLLREALPPERRHEAMYTRLRMTKEFAINPFDTQIGMRYPLPHERAFIINLLTLLCTPYSGKPYDGIDGMIGSVVDEVFKLSADGDATGSPKPYSPRIDKEVDEVIRAHAIKLPPDTTWWDVVDAFVEKGLWHEASMAQRYAVPTLSDTLLAARQKSIDDIYHDTRVGSTSETVPQSFHRMISTAVRDYPVLAGSTRFDIGGARVCALDLDEVASGSGDEADRRTALMYMLARHTLGRDYFLNEEMEGLFPIEVRAFHMKRIREIRESPKRLCFDEFHRANAPSVRRQVERDIREGRKWNIQIVLASQLLTDFTPAMVEQATGVWVCGVGAEENAHSVCEVFGLNDSSLDIIRRLRGPNSQGAPFLAVLSLREAKYVQHLYNSLGPIELWALSTTSEDSEIRNRLYKRVGARRARMLLTESFPRGSAKDEVENRVRAMAERGVDVYGQQDSILDQIVEELIERDMHIKRDKRVSTLEEENARLKRLLSGRSEEKYA